MATPKPIFVPAFDLKFSKPEDIGQQLRQFAQQITAYVGAGSATNATRIGSGAPIVLPTDASGDTYWDSVSNDWYIFDLGTWSQLAVGLKVNYTTGIIYDNQTGAIVGYLYKYLHIAYSTTPNGTLSSSPTGMSYFGVANNNNTANPTNPTDYTWFAGSFGTTNYLYYSAVGGRHINFQVASSAANAGIAANTSANIWQKSPTGFIDLDQVTGSGATINLTASISPTPTSPTGFTNPEPNVWLVPPAIAANNAKTWTASTITVTCTNNYPNNNVTTVNQTVTVSAEGKLTASASSSTDTTVTIVGNNTAAMQIVFANQIGTSVAYIYAANSASAVGTYLSFQYQYLNFAFADSLTPSVLYYTPNTHRYIGVLNWPNTLASANVPANFTWYDLGAALSSTNKLWINWNVGSRTIILETGPDSPNVANYSDMAAYQALYGNLIDLDSVSGFVVTNGNTTGGNYSTLSQLTNDGTLFYNLPYLLDFGGPDTTSLSNLTSLTIDRQGRIKSATQLDLLYAGETVSNYGSGPFTFNHVYGQALIYRNGVLLPITDYTEANPTVTSSGRTVASVSSNVVTFTGGDGQPFYTSDILQFGSNTTNYIVTNRNIAQITGSITSAVLTVTSVAAGTVITGMNVYSSGTVVGVVTGQTSGTTGNIGTYTLSGATNTSSTTLHCTDQKLTFNAAPTVSVGTTIYNASGSASVTVPSAASTDNIIGWKFTESNATGIFAYVPFTRSDITVTAGVTVYTPAATAGWSPGNEILYMNGVELGSTEYNYTTDGSGNAAIQLLFTPIAYSGEPTQYLTLVAFRKLSQSVVPFSQGFGNTVPGNTTVGTGVPLQQTAFTLVAMNGLTLQPSVDYSTSTNSGNIQLVFTPTTTNSVVATAFYGTGVLATSNSGIGADAVKVELEPGMMLANDNILISLGSKDPSSDGIFPIVQLPKSPNERFYELEGSIGELTDLIKSLAQEIKTLKGDNSVNTK